MSKHKDNKVEVSRIIIRIGDQDIDLTLEQARDLRAALDSTLGEKIERYIPYPQPYPVYPYRPYWTWEYRPYYGSIMVGDTLGNISTAGDSDRQTGAVIYSLSAPQQ